MTGADQGQPAPSRYIIGIDLGTTNSALAFINTRRTPWQVTPFPVSQVVAPGHVDRREVLPSFHLEAANGQWEGGELKLPWHEQPPHTCVGVHAREGGAAMPGRQISSAKSWLSHAGVDRTAGILPWHGAADVARLSPVEASSRILAHLVAAWDHAHPESPIAEQTVVLTVPASFDEVARELTIAAAREAGLVGPVLLEEPQAAFYAWIDHHREQWQEFVQPGERILVCDVGGGTTDLTLIEVRNDSHGRAVFHRIAVGEHLILGGDNLDLALARNVEQQLEVATTLSPMQWGALIRAARSAKERLLGDDPPGELTVSIPGEGSRLIGGALQVPVTRECMVERLLDGFLPRVALDAEPAVRRSGLSEFGLPYAPDPAITRYLAAFLRSHRDEQREVDRRLGAARPDMVLFNGGLFEAPLLRQRIITVLRDWFGAEGWEPRILENPRLDLAVSHGAASFGMARRGEGTRIAGGLARSYYIGVEAAGGDGAEPGAGRAVCLVPAGTEEGEAVSLESLPMSLRIRQPVEFPLYTSSVRTTDPAGAVIEVDPHELTELPPIRTVLGSGRRGDPDSLTICLHAQLTAIGTMALWCREKGGQRQWQLQFDVRSATQTQHRGHTGEAEAEGVLDEQAVTAARRIIHATFLPGSSQGSSAPRPESLVKQMEKATGMKRRDWPAAALRRFWEALMQVARGRLSSPEHEARWLNLLGFSLRPGYGLAVDDWRVDHTWKLFPQGVHHIRNEMCRAEWWILWRRIAGGLRPGQQRTLAEPLIAALRAYLRSIEAAKDRSGRGRAKAGKGPAAAFQYGPAETVEVWRLLGSLELIAPAMRLELAELAFALAGRGKQRPVHEAILWTLGRLGSRVPVYGPLNVLLPVEVVEAWVQRIVAEESWPDSATFAIVQMTRRTGDRYRDVSEATRRAALEWLRGCNAPGHYLELVEQGGELQANERALALGESLVRGLQIRG